MALFSDEFAKRIRNTDNGIELVPKPSTPDATVPDQTNAAIDGDDWALMENPDVDDREENEEDFELHKELRDKEYQEAEDAAIKEVDDLVAIGKVVRGELSSDFAYVWLLPDREIQLVQNHITGERFAYLERTAKKMPKVRITGENLNTATKNGDELTETSEPVAPKEPAVDVETEETLPSIDAMSQGIRRNFAKYGKKVTGKVAAKVRVEKSPDEQNKAFSEEMKILLITDPATRVMCQFMNYNNTNSIKNSPSSDIPLIMFLQHECLIRFMESKGYTYSGEINFDSHGNQVPTIKHRWTVGTEEVVFTRTGYIFFDANSNNKNDNVACYVSTDLQSSVAALRFYSSTEMKSKTLSSDLQKFAMGNNALRGCKLRDINLSAGTFSNVKVTGKHTWDNFYFEDKVKNLFDLEVFGFLKYTERYNKMGIFKRGIMLYGPPGTGKTTIGHIICNYAADNTVIWITPDLIAENNAQGKYSIKHLYVLADYVAPSVIILEDLDLFSEDRDAQSGNLALGALMNILDGVNTVSNAVTIATTNRLELIEKALSNRPGRFDSLVEIPPLEPNLRERMFTDRLSECKVEEGVIKHLVSKSDDWTGAETQEFINRMNLFFINRNEEDNRVVTKKVIDMVLVNMTSLSLQKRQALGF